MAQARDSVCDVVVIGGGIVGAACAYYATRAGLDAVVVDRGPVAGGTTGAGEGNILLSDKSPGPELDLALLSARLWQEIAAERSEHFGRLGQFAGPETFAQLSQPGRPGADRERDRARGRDIEFERKGGLVVAADSHGLDALHALAKEQRGSGVEAQHVAADELGGLEPQLAPGLAGGVFYPQDAQVQPALAAAYLIAAARRTGARLRVGETVTRLLRAPDGAVRAVATNRGEIHAPAVINAAGVWSGEVAALAGVALPVQPRRGFILVTEPLPPLIRHKVYAADYVADVASGSAALQTSAVVEGTASGPVLIGASRERVGFDRTMSLPVLRRLAAQAIELFPALATANAVRAYVGFRPYLPDHLPAIGPDPRVPGLFHACGHEGAGIGLAPATGYLIARTLLGLPEEIDMSAFRPDRFPVPVPAQERAC